MRRLGHARVHRNGAIVLASEEPPPRPLRLPPLGYTDGRADLSSSRFVGQSRCGQQLRDDIGKIPQIDDRKFAAAATGQ